MVDPSSSKKDLVHPFEEFDEIVQNSYVLNKKRSFKSNCFVLVKKTQNQVLWNVVDLRNEHLRQARKKNFTFINEASFEVLTQNFRNLIRTQLMQQNV